MTDRKELLASIDRLCTQIDALEQRAAKYTSQAVKAQQEAKRAWELSDDCFTKIRGINAEMDQVIAELRERKASAA